MNKWGIPEWLEEKVKKRDKRCVYCDKKMREYKHTKGTPKDKATWEHIDDNGPNSELNVVRCCLSCNASKGIKNLTKWFDSSYCKKNKINKHTVANIVQRFLKFSN